MIDWTCGVNARLARLALDESYRAIRLWLTPMEASLVGVKDVDDIPDGARLGNFMSVPVYLKRKSFYP